MPTPITEEDRKSLVESIRTALKSQNDEVMTALKKAEADIETFGKVQEGTKQGIADLNTKGQELQGRLLTLEQSVAAALKAGSRGNAHKSIGEQFVESDVIPEFKQRGGKGTSHAFECKAITSLAGSGGAGIWSTRLPGVVEEPLRPLSIRDLCDNGTTDSNLIEWVRENVYTSAADVVSEGAAKPESNITYQRVDVPVRTIAHWIHASKQVLSDFKQLATLINGRLTWGLKIAEENQLLFGDGTGENILGLAPQATPYNVALNRSGDTMIDVIRHAILQVRLSFYPASGVVLTPTDWHTIELIKDNENRYLMASPAGRLPPMLWGLPVVESDGMLDGDFMVGAFRMAATVFDREQAQILVSTEDRDNFIKNMVTILAEERLALAVSRPRAFVYGGWPAGASTGSGAP